MPKHKSKTRPSALLTLPSIAITTSTSDDSSTKSTSRASSFLVIDMGISTEDMPTINSTLAILLPTTLPRLMSALPSRALKKLTTNSGMLVPMATIVRPITISLTSHLRATHEAPSVNLSAPHTTMAMPRHKIRQSEIIVHITLYIIYI